MVHLTVCYYHVTYEFQSESTLYSLPNVKKPLAQSRHLVWSLSNSNRIWIHNHLVCQQTLNHVAKLVKWLSYIVRTYLSGAFECRLLSCHVRVSEWIHILWNPHSLQIWCLLWARSSWTFSQAIECEFTLKLVPDIIIRYSHMHHTDKYSQCSSIIHPVWLNGWMFVCELSGCRLNLIAVS